MYFRHFWGCLLVVSFAGCASFDPHGVISRHLGNGVPADGRLDAATREAAFDYVWNTINEAYLDPDFNGVDWKAVGMRQRAQVLGAENELLFWKRLDLMTGALHDAHTRVESPQRYEEIRQQAGVNLGIWLSERDDALLVERVGSSSEAWLAGLRPGARVLSIEGRPALEWWHEQLAATREGSAPWNRERRANGEFNTGKAGSSLAIEFERSDGGRVATRLARNRTSSKPSVLALHLSSGLGYLRFTAFDESIRSETLKALDSLRDTKGLIVDLRDNGGGSIRFAQAFASQFVSGRHEIARVRTRSGKPVTLMFGLFDLVKPEFTLEGPEKPFVMPLVVLMNSGSASASELTAAALQSAGRAKVVGDRSCGCLLGFLGYANVPGGGALAFSELGFVFRDGRVVEGVGVIPDVAAYPSRNDLVSGRDPQFEAAEALLNRK